MTMCSAIRALTTNSAQQYNTGPLGRRFSTDHDAAGTIPPVQGVN